MQIDSIVASLIAQLRRRLAGDARTVLQLCQRVLVANPTESVALYGAGQAIGDAGRGRFARRLRVLMSEQSLSAAAVLFSASGDGSRAQSCLRRNLLAAPGHQPGWRMLGQLGNDAHALYRSCLLSKPSAVEGLRLLLAFGQTVRDELAGNLPRNPLLNHLAAQAARCFRPPQCDIRARLAAARAALASLGTRLVFEPELQSAIAGVESGRAANRFFDLARVAILLEPDEVLLLQGLCALAWGPSEVDEPRETLAVQAIAWFLMAGGKLAGERTLPRYELLRTLLIRDQRQNHVPTRTMRYYALLNGAIDGPCLPDMAVRRRPAARRGIGFYVGDLNSITSRCFAPGLIIGLARNGIPCTIYTTTPAASAAGTVLHAFSREYGLQIRSLARSRIEDSIRTVAEDRNTLYVDLRGHSTDALPQLLAARPADRTAHMIGSGETSGIPGVDFLIVDRIAQPTDPVQRTEGRLLVLGGGLLNFTPTDMPSATLPRTGETGIRFGAFHQYSKINARCVSLWASALRETPNSSLTLKFNTAHEHGAERILLRMFAGEGISPHRILFAKRAVTMDEHFELMSTIDVLLDATPFNGETTTLEALWVGVPVVSVAGRRMIARFGASILHHAELDRLCAPSETEFGRTAAEVATHSPWLRDFRTDARSHLSRTPTFDAERYAEAAVTAFEYALAS